MILYGFYYNPCIYESAAALQSLHITQEGAEAAMKKFLEEWLEAIEAHNKWCSENDMLDCIEEVKFSDYKEVFVHEIEVAE